mmetsp:Transcript_4286/g.11962  ORF Transcript_4286/g.11962 Transcript_4286/m.11962 type:complete len:412 (+) Transcript_4286:131-1366(+)
MIASTINRRTAWASALFCFLVLCGDSSFAFPTTASTCSKRKLDKFDHNISLFSSQLPYDYSNEESGEQRRKQFRMVRQFNGDFKTVPYYEDDMNARNPAAEAEMRLLEARRRNPPLTSPARALLSKQWEWRRPSADQPRPRFRQVRTFSGDVKTVPFEERDPYFEDQITNSEFGRVDGTNYVPPLRARTRFAPPPPSRSDFPLSPLRLDRDYDERRREVERYNTKRLGNEFRREIRKYKRGDYALYDDENYDRETAKDPLKKLAKETEKFFRQVLGGNDKKRSRDNARREDVVYRPDPAMDDFPFERIGETFNSSPAIRSFETQQSRRPPRYYNEPGPRPSYSASRSVQSFRGENRPRRPKPYAVLGQPQYRMERQFNGEYRQVPVYDNDYDDNDDFFSNPSTRQGYRRTR